MPLWIYLSPHFDDVALSAGGLVFEQVQHGDQVEIWTICAGDPPSDHPLTEFARLLHYVWKLGDIDVPYQRSLEDASSCRILGAFYRRFTVPDVIYRYLPGTAEPVVPTSDDLFKDFNLAENYLITQVADFLRKNLTPGSQIVSPLSIGNHPDHVLTCRAAVSLGFPLWHYMDFPYIDRHKVDLKEWIPASAEEYSLPCSPAALQAWQDSILCHTSQIITLFPGEAEMHLAVSSYFHSGGGSRLWKF